MPEARPRRRQLQPGRRPDRVLQRFMQRRRRLQPGPGRRQDAEIGAAHTEGAAAAVRARQEADSAIAEVRAGAEAAAARAKAGSRQLCCLDKVGRYTGWTERRNAASRIL